MQSAAGVTQGADASRTVATSGWLLGNGIFIKLLNCSFVEIARSRLKVDDLNISVNGFINEFCFSTNIHQW